MDTDLRMLHELGVSRAPVDADPPERLRQRALSTTPRRRRPVGVPAPRRAGLRLAWRLGTAAAAAAAVIAAVLVGQTPNLGSAPPVASPGESGGTPVPLPAGGSAAAARVLNLAAEQLTSRPVPGARSDQYLLSEYVHNTLEYNRPGTSGPLYVRVGPLSLTRDWTSVDGTHDGLMQSRAWPAGGGWRTVAVSGCHNGRRAGDLTHPEYTEPCVPLPVDLDLPTSTGAMFGYLYRPGDDGGQYAGLSRDDTAFARANALISNPMTPLTRAAAYRAIARIPGISLAAHATDAAGRHGVAILRSQPGGRTELVFDPATHTYLGLTIRILDLRTFRFPGGEGAIPRGIRPGDPILQVALFRAVLVDRPGQLPGH